MGDADETFENADAGASEVIPMEAGQIRKGGYIVIKNRPCKVVSVSTSKTGKHGHASRRAIWQSVRFACDIISQGKKLEARSSRTLDARHDGAQRLPLGVHAPRHHGRDHSLMDEGGETREDLKMPERPEELVKSIREGFDAGDSLILAVVKAGGEEHVASLQEGRAKWAVPPGARAC